MGVQLIITLSDNSSEDYFLMLTVKTKICWLQLLHCKSSMLFSVTYDSK